MARLVARFTDHPLRFKTQKVLAYLSPKLEVVIYLEIILHIEPILFLIYLNFQNKLLIICY